jgi:hypothetical protein
MKIATGEHMLCAYSLQNREGSSLWWATIQPRLPRVDAAYAVFFASDVGDARIAVWDLIEQVLDTNDRLAHHLRRYDDHATRRRRELGLGSRRIADRISAVGNLTELRFLPSLLLPTIRK